MSDQNIHKIMTATEPADVAQMAIIECLRQIADGNKKLNSVLEGMQIEIRDVRERLIRIEASEFKAGLKAVEAETDGIKARVSLLELDKAGRTGAKGLADAVAKFGPLAVMLATALFIVLVATRQIVL